MADVCRWAIDHFVGDLKIATERDGWNVLVCKFENAQACEDRDMSRMWRLITSSGHNLVLASGLSDRVARELAHGDKYAVLVMEGERLTRWRVFPKALFHSK
jgi:hypothetical protein